MTLFKSMSSRYQFNQSARFLSIVGLVLSACLMVFVPSMALAVAGNDNVAIKLTLSKSTIISGETIALKATATNSDSKEKWDASKLATFTTTDPLGSITSTAYKAGQAGTWEITAHYGSDSASSKIIVTPGKASHLTINPNSLPEIVGIDRPAQFTATIYDANNNIVPNVRVVWSLSGPIGSVSATGIVKATRQGSGQLTGSAGNITSTINLVARPVVQDAPLPVAAPTNVNTQIQPPINANTGGVLGAATDTTVDDQKTGQKNCWDIHWWGWLLMMLGFLAILYGYYMLVEEKDSPWIWVVPALLTVGLIVLYFFIRCGQAAVWFPWISIAGALLITLFRPIKFVPSNGQSL